jgi:hypothetical protein
LPPKAFTSRHGVWETPSRQFQARRPRRRVKILPTISYDVMALIILLLIVFPLLMVFCLLSIASQEEAQMEKLAENLGVKIDLEALDRFGRNAGGDAPEKPGSAEARSLS